MEHPEWQFETLKPQELDPNGPTSSDWEAYFHEPDLCDTEEEPWLRKYVPTLDTVPQASYKTSSEIPCLYFEHAIPLLEIYMIFLLVCYAVGFSMALWWYIRHHDLSGFGLVTLANTVLTGPLFVAPLLRRKRRV